MKSLIAAALLVVCATTVAAGPNAKQGGKHAGTKAGLTQVANDYFAAINANDTKKVAEFFAPDYTFTDLDGKVLTRDDRLKAMAAQDNSKLVFSEIHVRTYGATGVVTGMATNADGARTRFTQTWAWQGGRWWLVAAQRSTIAP
ncbi:MAG TPA: nuclear transport factor 2 family protein [Pyrinomonadaceae bacterium]|jgi:hypothetical protein